jgi:2-haloacid dehalogenase
MTGYGTDAASSQSISRREFIGAIAAAAAVPRSAPLAGAPVNAVAFDALAIFDPAPVLASAERLCPGRGAALVDAWRRRQFEYTWLRVASRRYLDFWAITRDALAFAAEASNVALTASDRNALMGAQTHLHTWPDVRPVLDALTRHGLRLALLSNFTPAMLEANVTRGGLGGVFAHTLSTHRARTYKPAPAAYQLGCDALGLPRTEILFVASAGWDAAGAKMFGYRTFWVNRSAAPPEHLGADADGSGQSLDDMLAFFISTT